MLLERLATALQRPGVDGVLGTPDVLEDLLLSGLLDDKVVIGSMNRGGLQGATFELDDRFTAYDADTIAANGLDGGKMLTRIALDEPGTAPTLEASGAAVSALARHGLMAMVEPFMTVRTSPNRVENLLDPDSVIDSIHIAAGPRRDQRPHLAEAAGGRRDGTACSTRRRCPASCWAATPRATRPTPTPSGAAPSLTRRPPGWSSGRALLFPPDGDVASAVDAAVDLVHGGTR